MRARLEYKTYKRASVNPQFMTAAEGLLGRTCSAHSGVIWPSTRVIDEATIIPPRSSPNEPKKQ